MSISTRDIPKVSLRGIREKYYPDQGCIAVIADDQATALVTVETRSSNGTRTIRDVTVVFNDDDRQIIKTFGKEAYIGKTVSLDARKGKIFALPKISNGRRSSISLVPLPGCVPDSQANLAETTIPKSTPKPPQIEREDSSHVQQAYHAIEKIITALPDASHNTFTSLATKIMHDQLKGQSLSLQAKLAGIVRVARKADKSEVRQRNVFCCLFKPKNSMTQADQIQSVVGNINVDHLDRNDVLQLQRQLQAIKVSRPPSTEEVSKLSARSSNRSR